MFFGVDNLRGIVSSIGAYITALRSAESAEIAAAAGAKALRLGLDLLVNSLALVGIMLAVKGLTLLIDKLVVTKEELAEVRREALQGLESLKDGAEQLSEDTKSIAELVKQYKAIAESTDGIAGSEDTLRDIQDSLIDKLGDHAKGLDLVNDKYERQIELIEEASKKQQEDWKYRNASAIEDAEKILGYNVGWATMDYSTSNNWRGGTRVNPDGDYAQIFTDEEIAQVDELAASLYTIKGLSKDIKNVYKDIEGVSVKQSPFSTTVKLSGTVEEAIEDTKKLMDAYSALKGHDRDTLKALEDHYSSLVDALANAQEYMRTNIDQPIMPLDPEGGMNTDAITQLESLTVGVTEARTEWFKHLDEMKGGLGETVNSMVSALQTLQKKEGLSGEDFWNIMSFDKDKVLTDIQMVGDKFLVNEQQLIKLKDSYILKQIDSLKSENQSLETKKEELAVTLQQAKIEFQTLAARGGADATFRRELEAASAAIVEGEESLEAYGEQIRRNNIYIGQWRANLGNCKTLTQEIADAQEELTKAQKVADEYSKAMTNSVQNVIDNFENEKQKLEEQKDVLNDQLDILNKKKETIENTIEQYKSIVDVVKDISDAEIDALEARQEAEEEAVQSRIDALKEEKDQKEDATSLDEKQLELRKKLAELDKAKTTKVRTYSAARGWHFDVDAEAVNAAQSAADDAQKAYDTAVSNQQYDSEVKALEAQKKAISDNYKAQIKAQEDYYKQWSEITEAQEKAEKEQLAEQILGSNYREKIKDKDTGILNKFEGDFKSYNSQLNNLVKGEIASLQLSIKAKDEEIKAKGKQVDEWKRYKTEVESAISTITSKYNNYLSTLSDVSIKESDSYASREAALKDFAAKFDELSSLISQYQGRIKDLEFKAKFNDWDAREKMAKLISDYAWAIERMEHRLVESLTGYGIVNSPGDVAILEEAKRKILGFAQGGVIDYTGVANVHGTKNASEVAFNAGQAKELYNMVRSGSFANQVAEKAYNGLRTAMTKMNAVTNNTTNGNITINEMIIKANNPAEFHSQFMAEIGQYWNVKLTESRVK